MGQTIFTASNAAWPRPGDWNDANNSIEGIGGGGGGTDNSSGNGGAGGGGEYRRASNQTISATNNAIVVGAGGAAGTGTANDAAGAASTFKNSGGTTLMGANGGQKGSGTRVGGTGGTGAAANFNGGTGGGAATFPGGGGGGAGGPNGTGQAGGSGDAGTSGHMGGGGGGGGAGGGSAGANGVDSGGTGTSANGGAGGNRFGGGGGGAAGTSAADGGAGTTGGGGGGGGYNSGTGNSTNGGAASTEDGTTYAISWGSSANGAGSGAGGPGGAAVTGPAGLAGKAGGLYGGGGSGGAATNTSGGNGGAGAAGIVVVTWTPAGGFPPGVMPGNPVYELSTGTKFPASFEQPQLRTWTGSYKLNLIGKDRLPTGQYPDWTVQDLPASPPPLHQQRTWTWAYNLNLIGKDRLPVGVFPGNELYELTAGQVRPPDQVQLRTWTASFNLNLIPQVQLPAGDQAYDLTAGQRPPDQVQLRTWTWSYNLNLIGKDRLPPGGQAYDRLALPPPPALTWIQASVTYLTPVAVQRPFTQSDWPLPLAPWRPDFTWTQRNANLTPAAMPGAVDWDLPTPPPTLLQQSIFPTLAQRAAPPAQLPPGDQLYDRPVLGPVPAATTWIDYLRFIVVPFNQTDWPLPLAPLQPIRTWTASYNLDLIGQDKLPPGEQATDLAPRGPLRSQDLLTWIQTVNLTLVTAPPNIFAQARQSDWPVPKGPEPDWRRSWTHRNANLTSAAMPGAIVWDLPTPPPALLQQSTWSYNLNLIGKDQLPVGDQVTDLAPRDFPRLLQTWIQQTNLALLAQPPVLPHNQTDWPVPKAPQQPAQSWTTSYNLNLIGKDRLPTRQQDWPLPGGHTIPTLLQTWASSRAILFPAPVFPPGDQFFDRPQLRRDTPPDFYFIGARYPIIPPPIVVIGASYRLLSSHYLYNVYYLPNTVVTEGAEVPFGWVPTLAVDPLNAAAAAAYYAAGPRHTAYEDMNTYSTMYRPVYPDVPVNTPVTHWRQVPGTGLYVLTGLGAGNPPVGGD